MYLIDTNVWLERLLNQERSEEVHQFLDRISSENLYITDFAFHSIGVILSTLKETKALVRFARDIFIEGAVNFIRLEPEDTESLVNIINQFNLDFDDAYQYVSAEKHNLTIVSFDPDFDRTKRGRKTPAQVLE